MHSQFLHQNFQAIPVLSNFFLWSMTAIQWDRYHSSCITRISHTYMFLIMFGLCCRCVYLHSSFWMNLESIQKESNASFPFCLDILPYYIPLLWLGLLMCLLNLQLYSHYSHALWDGHHPWRHRVHWSSHH